MNGKYVHDIIIEGNNLTATTLAYFLSLNYKNKAITLLQREDIPNRSFFTPNIITPVFELPDEFMSSVFKSSKEKIAEVHSISGHFEYSQISLILLYKELETLEIRKNHEKKLTCSEIKHKNLSQDEISTYYPFISSQEEIMVTEIYESFTCSDVNDLMVVFQKLAEENGVEIIGNASKIDFYEKEGTFETEDNEFTPSEFSVVTSPEFSRSNSIVDQQVLRVTTPILENFPRINLVDVSTNTQMWLEESGYFQIFRIFNEVEEMECVKQIKDNFKRLFPLLGVLQTIDSNFINLKINTSLEESVGSFEKSKTYYFHIPTQMELSIIPSLAERFSILQKKNENEFLSDISLKKILSLER
jgi:hypothetical protein